MDSVLNCIPSINFSARIQSFSELFMSEESSGVRALVGNLVSSSILETPGEIINSPYLSAVPSIN